jgi:hypothetical protein
MNGTKIYIVGGNGGVVQGRISSIIIAYRFKIDHAIRRVIQYRYNGSTWCTVLVMSLGADIIYVQYLTVDNNSNTKYVYNLSKMILSKSLVVLKCTKPNIPVY